MDKIIEQFTEEERARYDFLKDTSVRLHPSINNDNVKSEMVEYLYIYYAKNNKLPDRPIET